MFNKTLWIAFEHTAADLIAKAKLMGASAVAVRTMNPSNDNPLDKLTIARYHEAKLKVYGWMFPAIEPGRYENFRYAKDEADHVATKLVPAGLDGYFFDPEGHDRGKPRNWDQQGLDDLAKYWCMTIKAAVPAGQPFLFGLSSHFKGRSNYPKLPWSIFVQHCDIMLPQSYWRMLDDGHEHEIGHGPQKNYAAGKAEWATFAQGKPVIPMAGELGLVTRNEIEEHVRAAAGRDLHLAATDGIRTELHFYTDTLAERPENYEFIGQLGK